MKALQDPGCRRWHALLASAAQADITIGVSLPLTGPASGLGIPMANYIKLWPTTIAGEKLKVIVLDDATDPTKGVTNAKKFVTEDKVDIIMGSAATPVAIAMADAVAESETLQFMLLAGRAARRQGHLDVPPAAGQRGDGVRDDRAHEEAGRQDRRLPRLHRRLRRELAERLQGAVAGARRPADRRRRALRARRHQRHRAGAQAGRRPTPTRC